jgi:hypothetical protein
MLDSIGHFLENSSINVSAVAQNASEAAHC